MLRLLASLLVTAGALLLAGGAPARAQLVVEPGALSVSLAQGEAAERAVTVTNAGAEAVSFCLSFDRPLQRSEGELRLESRGEACGAPGEVLYRIDREGLPGCCADPYGLTMTPDGRLFAAEYVGGRTYELTPGLAYVRHFEHPFVAELEPNPVTTGLAYNTDTGTLWWMNKESVGPETYRALLIEGDLDGVPTGHRIELPLAPAPPPYYAGSPVGHAYDPDRHRYYFVDTITDAIWAVDTLGNTVPGYPVEQSAYPGGYLGKGVDVHGGPDGGSEGVRLEAAAARAGEGRLTRVVALDRHGAAVGVETPIPDLSDGTFYGTPVGNPLRSRVDPNGVLYLAFSNFATEGIVGLRPHPLPPSWLAVDAWSGTLGPGESAKVVLTFAAGLREVGDYTASLQVIEAASGAVTEVPLVLSVTQGTAAEPGPVAESVRLLVYPNPARGRAEVVLKVPEAGEMEAAVYDALGRRVTVLHAGLLGAGEHALPLDVAGLPAGVYVVRVVVGGVVATRTLTVRR